MDDISYWTREAEHARRRLDDTHRGVQDDHAREDRRYWSEMLRHAQRQIDRAYEEWCRSQRG